MSERALSSQERQVGAAPEPGLPLISPDIVEQELGGEMDDIVPTHGFETLPIVGLGGSAGSIGALQAFFAAMPPESGMAFVVILHLSPEHESALAEMLGRTTTMRVVQAHDRQEVKVNTVYVIPPGKHLASTNGHLNLVDLQAERGTRMAVDLFFRTLADSHGMHSAAIVLSGANGDGAIGIKRIKERGGLTIAQDPEEAEHPSMPRTAIDTGMVDWVLPVAQMPARLLDYLEKGAQLKLPPEEGPQPAAPPPAAPSDEERALREVLGFLHARTGRDFSCYKRATIVRRVSRRMQVNGVVTVPEYLDYIRTHPGEATALLQDLLISVTNFFRDRDCFSALESKLPHLFSSKAQGEAIRVWVPACATGEEAYSIAMLLTERASLMDVPPSIQVFATDLSEDAISTAREALYPATIAADVNEDRLRRFFTREHRGYRVRRELRECVLFATHDLLKDAPFSKLDLISCRNLLIYLTGDAQKRAINTFHFALKPNALLLLGSSESLEADAAAFQTLDKKHRLFAQIPLPRTSVPLLTGPGTVTRAIAAQERAAAGPFVHGAFFTHNAAHAAHTVSRIGERGVSWEEVHFKLIERFAPPSLIVTRDYEIVHISENAGRFLHFRGGEPSVNLMSVVVPALRTELRAALFRAAQTSTPVEVFRVPAELEGKLALVDIRVSPAQEIAPDFLLVVFSIREGDQSETAQAHIEAEPAVLHLEREIEQVKSRLRDTVEQYETSTEELKASNEELQAMNEELRSATEELETSREELQSINEELVTVNQELKSKVDELGHSNSDLNNLMAATAIATIFLDRSLHIMRYTPSAVALFRLIPSDVGRPLTDLTHGLNYPDLKQEAERVLETLVPVKREVSDGEGRWFLVGLLPYRTSEDQIVGAVLTFVDITDRRLAEAAVESNRQQMEAVLRHLPIGVILSEAPSGKCLFHNQEAERLVGYALPIDSFEQFDRLGGLHPDGSCCMVEDYPAARCLSKGETVDQEEVTHRRPDGTTSRISVSSAPIRDASGRLSGVVTALIDIEPRRRTEDALRGAETRLAASQDRLRLIVENAREYAIFALDLERRITSWNAGAERILGYSEEESLGKSADIIFTPEDIAAGAPEQEAGKALDEGRAADERWHIRKDGTRFWGSGVMMSMHDAQGEAIGLVKIFRDKTTELRAKETLEKSREELVAALQETEQARAAAEVAASAKDHFLAVLSHELRTPLTPVLMAVHTLLRRKNLPAGMREALEMIRRNVQIEAHFIDDLLDLTRISRGKLELVREPLDLHQAVQHAIQISQPDLDAKGQRLFVALEATEHQIIGDATRLQQVFWNLLKNAAKFSPDGSEIRVSSRNEPGGWFLEVSDNGIGFEPEHAVRIFDPFTQATDRITREFGGLGLGLAITKASIDGHGGTVRAHSLGRGKGATFTIEIPLSSAAG